MIYFYEDRLNCVKRMSKSWDQKLNTKAIQLFLRKQLLDTERLTCRFRHYWILLDNTISPTISLLLKHNNRMCLCCCKPHAQTTLLKPPLCYSGTYRLGSQPVSSMVQQFLQKEMNTIFSAEAPSAEIPSNFFFQGLRKSAQL